LLYYEFLVFLFNFNIKGIGECASRIFASHGLNVVLTARRKDKLNSIVEDINKLNQGKAIAFEVDVTSESDQHKAFIGITYLHVSFYYIPKRYTFS
jgi:lysophospholipid acyltransferase (LPLAT)-like uncharacterized protein